MKHADDRSSLAIGTSAPSIQPSWTKRLFGALLRSSSRDESRVRETAAPRLPTTRTLAPGSRVLVVTPIAVFPPTGGSSARILSLIEGLQSLGFEVHVAYLESDSPFWERGDTAGMQERFGQRFHRIVHRRPSTESALQRRLLRKTKQLLGMDSGWIWDVDDFFDLQTIPQLRALQDRIRVDAVLVEYVFVSLAFEAFGPTVRRIIDTHDIFSNRHSIYLSQGRRPTWFSTTPESERRGLSRADVVLAIQDGEAKELSRISGCPVVTVSHAVPIHEPSSQSPRAPNVLFVGSDNSMNVEGICWFIDAIWPRVHERYPDARVFVGGSVSAHVAARPGVERLGRLSPEDLRSLYARTRVAINPVQYGTGMSIKSVEATGYGVPVLTTTAGARGLQMAMGRGVHVADNADAFVAQLGVFLRDGDWALRQGQAALDFAREWNRRQACSLNEAITGVPASLSTQDVCPTA